MEKERYSLTTAMELIVAWESKLTGKKYMVFDEEVEITGLHLEQIGDEYEIVVVSVPPYRQQLKDVINQLRLLAPEL